MKNVLKTVPAVLISALSFTLANDGAYALTLNLSTGFTGLNGGANYSVSGPVSLPVAPTLTGSNLNPAYVVGNTATSQWIGAQVNSNTSVPAGNYTFSTTFSLAGTILSTATITPLIVSSDNQFTSLSLNGTALALSPATPAIANPDLTYTAFTTYNLLTSLPTFRGLLNQGNNTLAFTVNNFPLINGVNPSSLRAEYSVTATNRPPGGDPTVPFEFEATSGLLLIGGYFATKKALSKKKA